MMLVNNIVSDIKLSVLLTFRRRFMLMFVLVILQHYCRLFC